ncbi:MAG: sodium/glutamate symporter [Flintibacter sp.]|uniref:sodium/glutamate symporter n=1 Tax=Flintibacter sp. TaxID=1918624 RepID=UPI0026723707|nr:sodium/glutamate symporter [Flintibacter sp.]MCI6150181.1 sodium/glutamate symporter [Flintibacter sp.]MDD7116645.1 sodium/glutamate symporter [Flintibacter sp.]MDY5037924.1 sodium/glutamate symporter [Lawsonibacter sp.]
MQQIALNMYQTAAIAMMLFVLGRFLTNRIEFLKKCCIPAPVVGGLIFALTHLALRMAGVVEFTFDSNVKDFFMTLFFTSVGYTACFRLLKKGGKKVITFLIVAIIMVCLQNVVSSILAGVFDWDLRLGLCTGSIPMVGGHGTAGSYGPMMENDLGIARANVIAIAAATYGLVAGSLMGGPTARSIINKYNLKSTESGTGVELDDMSAADREKAERVDVDAFTNAAILLIVAAGLGTLLTAALNNIQIDIGNFHFKFTFPTYIGAMLIAAVIRNFCDAKHIVLPSRALDLWGNVSLSIFLAIALMSVALWQLAEVAGPMIVMLVAQTVLMFFFARFVVYNIMGHDYEAAVMTAAFCGFGMGATPNAMANMQAVTKRYGPAPQAYFIVPLVGSLFIDFFNGLIITGFLNVLPIFG